jgi:hypothetical protein
MQSSDSVSDPYRSQTRPPEPRCLTLLSQLNNPSAARGFGWPYAEQEIGEPNLEILGKALCIDSLWSRAQIGTYAEVNRLQIR